VRDVLHAADAREEGERLGDRQIIRGVELRADAELGPRSRDVCEGGDVGDWMFGFGFEEEGERSPRMREMRVLLPAPLGPRSA
jgi:hypothetical protein